VTPATLSVVIGHQGDLVQCNTVVALRPQPKQHMYRRDTAPGKERCVFVDGVFGDFGWRELAAGGQPVECRHVVIVVN